jgi:hypothetical protein
MSARLLAGVFTKADGAATEDFEGLPIGTVLQLPGVVGNAGVVLQGGYFAPRQP